MKFAGKWLGLENIIQSEVIISVPEAQPWSGFT